MAYETTEVPVERSQGSISKLIFENGGSGLAMISDRAGEVEGFEANMVIDGSTYRIRVTAVCKKPKQKWSSYHSRYVEGDLEQERRRLWRVLFHHLKNVFESSKSGVMEFRKLMLPFIVIPGTGQTIAEHILPRLAEAVAGNPARLLGSGAPEDRP